MRIKTENEKLKAENSKIESKISRPDEDVIKSSAENQELERAKDYLLSKNVEIEQLIKQVMGGGSEPPKEDPNKSSSVANMLS